MSNRRSSFSKCEMLRFRSYCTARSFCRVSTNVLPRRVDRRALFRGDHRLSIGGLFGVAGTGAPLAQRLQLLLHVVQVRLQGLLGLPEPRFRLGLHRVHQGERMVGIAARAQPDQRIAAGQRVDQVGDERRCR